MKKLEKHQMLNAGLVLLFLIAVALACLFRDDGREDYEKGMAAYAAEDWEKAARLFELAAEKGDPRGQFYFTQCLMNGVGVHTNMSRWSEWERKAQKSFRKKAESGDPEAMYYLGVIRYNYPPADPDRDEGVFWLKKAASAGNAQAQALLGKLPRFEELLQAAENGDADAMLELADWYRNGTTGMELDREAVDWLQKAADKGRTDVVEPLLEIAWKGRKTLVATLRLGKLAENGNDEAILALVRLAEAGHSYAVMEFHDVVRAGHPEVMETLIKLAGEGRSDAMRILRLLVQDGFDGGLETLVKLAEDGDTDAIDELRALVSERKGGEEPAARTLLKLAADGNKDAKKAVRRLEKSENEDLKNFLGRMKNNP